MATKAIAIQRNSGHARLGVKWSQVQILSARRRSEAIFSRVILVWRATANRVPRRNRSPRNYRAPRTRRLTRVSPSVVEIKVTPRSSNPLRFPGCKGCCGLAGRVSTPRRCRPHERNREAPQGLGIIRCARHRVGERLRHARCFQSGVLLIQGRGDGADTHITYTRPVAGRCGWMRISVCHKVLDNPGARSIPETAF